MAELEKLCAELGRTSDPNKVWELECEIERIAELIKEGGRNNGLAETA